MTDGEIEGQFCRAMGLLIQKQRMREGMTQEDLGCLVGVHRNTINRWEGGDSPLDVWQLLRIADVLHCNHLSLLPPFTFRWGRDLRQIEEERNGPFRRYVPRERDFPKGTKRADPPPASGAQGVKKVVDNFVHMRTIEVQCQ